MKKSVTSIETAVMPLKEAAVARAVKYAQDIITQVLADLEANGMDAAVCAPIAHGRMGRGEYRMAMVKYSRYRSLTTMSDKDRRNHMPRKTDIRLRCEENEAVFLKQTAEAAAAQYDAFVAKLVAKVGDHYGARLEGDHVWSHSILTVWKTAQPAERWKTQTIINVSKLGKVFNQWPTRKVK